MRAKKTSSELDSSSSSFAKCLHELFPNMKFNTPVPTTVMVFKSDELVCVRSNQSQTRGYFQPGPDVNYIALTTEVRGEHDPFSVIFHEYTHLLVNNTFENAPSGSTKVSRSITARSA